MMFDGGPLKPAGLAQRTGIKTTIVSVALNGLKKKKLTVRGSTGRSLTAAGRADLARRHDS